MVKLISTKSIFFIGKVDELRLHLASIEDRSITLAEYIRLQTTSYKNSLN